MAKSKHAKSKKSTIIIIIVIAVVALLIAALFFVLTRNQNVNPEDDQDNIITAVTHKVQGYDFDKLQRAYPDIYAWIDIPNTNISQPVVQHPTQDSFYLNHNAHQEFDINGAIYTELANSKDFSDPVTVVYGHNMNDGTMLAAIHYFEDPTFFANNDKFYVYMRGHKLTYKVVAAKICDNGHILNLHNFKDKQVLLNYYNEIKTSLSQSNNVRQDVELNADSKILQLSTCVSDPRMQNQRYIVTGVLADDQETY